MADYVLVPLDATTAARVPIPADIPITARGTWHAKLKPADYAEADRVPLPAPAPVAPTPDVPSPSDPER